MTGVLLIGFISGMSTADAINGWYTTINKPSFNPPNYLFGPVWTLLYALMGVSLFLVLRQEKSPARVLGLRLFAVQLVLNFFWSIIFFRFQLTGWALVEIICMWVVIAAMIRQFVRIKPIAGWIQVPYLLWVSFATLLNASICYLN
jgi:tryptophan-rich sensory protein